MRRSPRPALALAVLAIAAAPLTSSPLAFVHVTVIDATGAPARGDMTVVIAQRRIVRLGPTREVKVATHARIIDGRNKFLIPGLWDMHVHSTLEERKWILPLYVASGVTGIRHMGGNGIDSAPDFRRLRAEIASGGQIGPRFLGCVSIVDGPLPVWPDSIPVSTEEEGRRAVRALRERGADFIKVYSLVPRPAYFGIADEARRQGIPFAGHVPIAVRLSEASDAGQVSIEHVGSMALGAGEAKDAELFRRLARNGTWFCPTLVLARSLAHPGDGRREALRYVSASMREAWDLLRVDRLPAGSEAFSGDLEAVRQMHAAGVQFLAGSDVGMPDIVPGFSLHEELRLLVQAGLSPIEALQTATRNPARMLGTLEESGTVEEGKVADLVLLNANPLQNIGNTERISAVVLNGRYLDRQVLDRMLETIRRQNGRSGRLNTNRRMDPATRTGVVTDGGLR